MSMVTTIDIALGRRAVDALLEHYVAWREECETVWQAYQRWVDADRHERWLAHAGYLAALDREEQAACTYADHLEHVRRISPWRTRSST
jgi:hypothetical protein